MTTSLTVKQRIWIGFGALVLLTIVAGGLNISTTRSISTDFTGYHNASRETVLLQEADRALIAARAATFRFRVKPSAESAEGARAAIQAMIAGGYELREALEDDPQALDIIRRLVAKEQEYSDAFEEVVALQARRDAHVEAIVTHGVEARQALSVLLDQMSAESNANALYRLARSQQALLLGRSYMERFLSSNAQADFDRSQQEVATARTELETLQRLTSGERGASVEQARVSMESYAAEGQALLEVISERNRVKSEKMDVIGPEIREGYTALIGIRANRLATLGQQVVADAETSQTQTMLLTAVFLVVGLGAAYVVGRSIILPLQGVAGAARAIADGDAANVPHAQRKDEIGALAASVQRINHRAIEAVRVRRSIDSSSALVMIADSDHTIVYVNDTLKRMLVRAEPEIRKTLPQFQAEAAVGANIDIFHKNPSHQRRMIDALTNTHDTRLTLGSIRFALSINPVRNESGERIGTVVEWRDVTAEESILGDMDSVVSAAVEGDFSQRITLSEAEPSLTLAAERVNTLIASVDTGVAETERVMQRIAEGDLKDEMRGSFAGKFEKLQGSVNATVGRLRELVGEIQGASSGIASSTDAIASGAGDLSSRAESQAASLQETAATMEEMAATIKGNADNAKIASDMSEEAAQRAQRGGDVVSETVTAMSNIEASSAKISDILAVIDGIAFQTNLLALNAAVEAARAGDAGKGFAVVASEVRALAQRSGDAAKDIRALIDESAGHVADGARLVNLTGEALEEINTAILKVRDTVSDISDATSEQATGVEEISSAISNLDALTQQNAALAGESSATARELLGQSGGLGELVRQFDTGQDAPPRMSAPRREKALDASWAATEARQAQQSQPAQAAGAVEENGQWSVF